MYFRSGVSSQGADGGLLNAAEAMVWFKMNASSCDVITGQATCNFLRYSALEQRIQSRIQAEEEEQQEEQIELDGLPVVNAELGREDGGRPPIVPIAQGDRHFSSHSSGASHLTAVWERFRHKKQSLITTLQSWRLTMWVS